jgi:hypothetical protein
MTGKLDGMISRRHRAKWLASLFAHNGSLPRLTFTIVGSEPIGVARSRHQQDREASEHYRGMNKNAATIRSKLIP